jgi:hypothetical protein
MSITRNHNQTQKQYHPPIKHTTTNGIIAGIDPTRRGPLETIAIVIQCRRKLGLGFKSSSKPNLGLKLQDTTPMLNLNQPWIYPLSVHSATITPWMRTQTIKPNNRTAWIPRSFIIQAEAVTGTSSAFPAHHIILTNNSRPTSHLTPQKLLVRQTANSQENTSNAANMSVNSRSSPRFKKPPAPERYISSYFYYLSHKQCIWVQSPYQYTTGLKPKHGRPFKSYLQHIYQFHLHCLSALSTSDINYCSPLVFTKFMEHGMMRYPHHNSASTPHKV